MNSYADTDAGRRPGSGDPPGHSADRAARSSARLSELASRDVSARALVDRLLAIADVSLPAMYLGGEFAYRSDGQRGPDGRWRLSTAGTSLRYTAIAALGVMLLPEHEQRQMLGGDSCDDLIATQADKIGAIASLGDAAVLGWAAAEAGHPATGTILEHLISLLDRADPQRQTVDLAWTVTALVAGRDLADVEAPLARARGRLLDARGPVLYPHVTGSAGPWYRRHVASFADQVYPMQALARLHASVADSEALAVASDLARVICDAQGSAGQWWWHYDVRTGAVVEGYPVYSVHQYGMAPMALLDLRDAGGPGFEDAICRGLRWEAGPNEAAEPLVVDDVPVIWRKAARSDPRKLVRGSRSAAATLGMPLPGIDLLFRPGPVDHESRPYELGWLYFAWLSC